MESTTAWTVGNHSSGQVYPNHQQNSYPPASPAESSSSSFSSSPLHAFSSSSSAANPNQDYSQHHHHLPIPPDGLQPPPPPPTHICPCKCCCCCQYSGFQVSYNPNYNPEGDLDYLDSRNHTANQSVASLPGPNHQSAALPPPPPPPLPPTTSNQVANQLNQNPSLQFNPMPPTPRRRRSRAAAAARKRLKSRMQSLAAAKTANLTVIREENEEENDNQEQASQVNEHQMESSTSTATVNEEEDHSALDWDTRELDRELNMLASQTLVISQQEEEGLAGKSSSFESVPRPSRPPPPPYDIAVQHLDALKKRYGSDFAHSFAPISQAKLNGAALVSGQQPQQQPQQKLTHHANHHTDINANDTTTPNNNNLNNNRNNINHQTALAPDVTCFPCTADSASSTALDNAFDLDIDFDLDDLENTMEAAAATAASFLEELGSESNPLTEDLLSPFAAFQSLSLSPSPSPLQSATKCAALADPLSIADQQSKQQQQHKEQASGASVSSFNSSSSSSRSSTGMMMMIQNNQPERNSPAASIKSKSLAVNHNSMMRQSAQNLPAFNSQQSTVQSMQNAEITPLPTTSATGNEAPAVYNSHPQQMMQSTRSQPSLQYSEPLPSFATLSQTPRIFSQLRPLRSPSPPQTSVLYTESPLPVVVLQHNLRNAVDEGEAAFLYQDSKQNVTTANNGQPQPQPHPSLQVYPAHQSIIYQIIRKLVFAPLKLEQMIAAIESRISRQQGDHEMINFSYQNNNSSSTTSNYQSNVVAENASSVFTLQNAPGAGSSLFLADCMFCPHHQHQHQHQHQQPNGSNYPTASTSTGTLSACSPFTAAAVHLWAVHSRASFFCRHCGHRFAERATFVYHFKDCNHFKEKCFQAVRRVLLGPPGTQLLVWNNVRELLQLEGSTKKWAAFVAHLFMTPSESAGQSQSQSHKSFFEIMRELQLDELLPKECRLCAIHCIQKSANNAGVGENDNLSLCSQVTFARSNSFSYCKPARSPLFTPSVPRSIEVAQAVRILTHLAAHHAYFRFICLPCASKHLLFLKLYHFEKHAPESLNRSQEGVLHSELKLDLATLVRCSVPFALGPFLAEHRRVAHCADDHYDEGTIVLVRYLTVSFLEEAFTNILKETTFDLGGERDAYTKAEVRALQLTPLVADPSGLVTLPENLRAPFEVAATNTECSSSSGNLVGKSLPVLLELMAQPQR